MKRARFDLYASIHKALRSFMADTLGALGRMDVDDELERTACLSQLRALLDVLERHARHENEFIHPAIETRRPGAAAATAAEHAQQQVVLSELHRLAQVVGDGGAQRSAAARTLYRQLSLFIADNLKHMHEEETVNNAVLWMEYTDAELASIQDRLVAAVEAEEMAQVMRWMAPSIAPDERAALFGALRTKASAEAFERLLETVRPHLAPRDWNKLTRAIAAAPLAA